MTKKSNGTRPTKKFGVSILVLMVVAALTTATAAAASSNSRHNRNANSGPAVYEITVTNTTSGQYLTPPNWAIHDNDVNVYQRNTPASPGVVAVAENGGVPILAAELTAALDNTGLGDSGVGAAAPIAPGESATFTATSSHDRLSIVSMIICTNDGFGGVDSKKLPNKVGQSKSIKLHAHDAGSEINTELDADIVPAPFCGAPSVGTGMSNPALAENGVIKTHRTIRGVGDLDSTYDWTGPVGQVTVTRIG